MKHINVFRFLFFSAMLLSMSGCLKDKCTRTYSFYRPVYKTTEEVRANIKSNAPRGIKNTGKIFIYGKYIFLNELDRGIHIIDNSNPASPQNIAFIDIPGNVDMAAKGNTLYADAYTDLIVLDISNPSKIGLKKVIENVFPYRFYYGAFEQDKSMIITDWVRIDTTVEGDCGSGGFFGFMGNKEMVAFSSTTSGGDVSSNSGSGTLFGMGGSMARFSIVQNNLYTVTTSRLNVFKISEPFNPTFIKDVEIGWNIETIYPFRNQLFIGSSSGMFIYNISDPANPVQTGRFEHARSCDPVIADDQFAYVTLRSGSTCEGFNNQLDIVDLGNPVKPILAKTYSMTNPHGLAKDGNLLFICDGKAGLKIMNAQDVYKVSLVSTIKDIEAYDVIAFKGIALVTAKGGLYQYDYTKPENLLLLSKILITP